MNWYRGEIVKLVKVRADPKEVLSKPQQKDPEKDGE